MTSPNPTMTSSLWAVRSALSEIIIVGDSAWETPRRFTGFAKRLQLVINQLHRWLSPDNIPASIRTSLKGIAGDLLKAAETLALYKNKSKIFVLINCRPLCASFQERTLAIGGWLALLHSALHQQLPPELQTKIAHLSSGMKQAHFTVTENEERVFQALLKERQGRRTSKAVQNALVMDLARALGIEYNNHTELSEQVELLRRDLSNSDSDSDRRILATIDRIMDYRLIDPGILAQKLELDFEEEAQLLPFKNFLCPLTKEVMKDPVLLESGQTYERTAIGYWFGRCTEDGREPTCPVTGMVLSSMELKPNIGLAGAIEEWVNRNIDIQVKSAVQCLSEESPSVDTIELVLDRIYKISEENPGSRYKIRNAGLVVLVVRMLKSSSKRIGSCLRSKALMVLLTMAKDDESKMLMLEEGTTRLAIHSLIGSSDKEKEYAVKLLLEFSSDETYCVKLASEKGSLVLLSSLADNRDNPSLSHLADDVLKRMEKMEDNIKDLAAAGRFEPLLRSLREGSNDIKVDMASILGSMTLTSSGKEQIAHQAANVLVELLWKPEGREASLQALHNLSSLDDNATILVDSGVLPALMHILFETDMPLVELQELAAAIIANIVANPGYWELASADREGNLMHLELIVSKLLVSLSLASTQCQLSILQIVYHTASSPQASESVTTYIKSGDGIKTVVRFLRHPQVEHRTYAFRITRILSERLSEDLAKEIRASHKLLSLKDKILDNQSTESEMSDSAHILANITLTENEVKTLLEASFVKWIVTCLKNQQYTPSVRDLQAKSSMVEGLLGILLHFMRRHDLQTISIIKELHLTSVLRDQLVSTSKPRVKQLAALGLGCLSQLENVVAATRETEREPSKWFCSSMTFMCAKASASSSSCPIHSAPCQEDDQLCLLRSNCIKPLVDLLKDNEANVQVAAVQALSTLLPDTSKGFKQAVDELDDLGVVDAVILLFTEAWAGELQEKAILMVERMLRSESLSTRQSLNQALFRALVEAFKHGSNITKGHAQGALTSLKQISGVSGKTTSESRQGR